MWHTVKHIPRLETAEKEAEAQIGPDSPWFEGHFPDDPVVPGVAQLGMVLEALRQLRQQSLTITEIRRIRFRRIIRPNEPIRIFTTETSGRVDTVGFRIMVDEEMVCNGMMVVKAANLTLGENKRI
ncbi:MAG: hypothetical protein ACOZF0_16385 [Thermodesulfobacteriota bacterium]